MTACLAPACPDPRLDLGDLWMLCLEHALAAFAATPPKASRTAPERPNLRRRCWGLGLTCEARAVTVTAHGGYCREHAPIQPRPPVVEAPSEAETHAGQLAVLAVMGAFPGASISADGPSLWATRSYGDSDEVQTIPGRAYPRSTPSRAVTVEPADERVPRTARSMARNAKGWSVRLRHVEEPPSTVLRAWRGTLLVVASWDGTGFVSAWVQHSKSLPMALGARQAANLLKAA